jgi:hypothetical protein
VISASLDAILPANGKKQNTIFYPYGSSSRPFKSVIMRGVFIFGTVLGSFHEEGYSAGRTAGEKESRNCCGNPVEIPVNICRFLLH